MSSRLVKRTLDEWFAERTQLVCFYCACELTRATATLDHLTPLARGGKTWRMNIALACGACNRAKGCLTEREFRLCRRDHKLRKILLKQAQADMMARRLKASTKRKGVVVR